MFNLELILKNKPGPIFANLPFSQQHEDYIAAQESFENNVQEHLQV
jgi:hypothetical protein